MDFFPTGLKSNCSSPLQTLDRPMRNTSGSSPRSILPQQKPEAAELHSTLRYPHAKGSQAPAAPPACSPTCGLPPEAEGGC